MTKSITTGERAPTVLETPLVATLRSFTSMFEVRCEVTGEWLSRGYHTLGYLKEQDEWRETLKKADSQFYKVREEGNVLWILTPVGFWLKDGRLVSPECTEGERAEPYYGTKAEIVGRRTIRFIKDE